MENKMVAYTICNYTLNSNSTFNNTVTGYWYRDGIGNPANPKLQALAIAGPIILGIASSVCVARQRQWDVEKKAYTIVGIVVITLAAIGLALGRITPFSCHQNPPPPPYYPH